MKIKTLIGLSVLSSFLFTVSYVNTANADSLNLQSSVFMNNSMPGGYTLTWSYNTGVPQMMGGGFNLVLSHNDQETPLSMGAYPYNNGNGQNTYTSGLPSSLSVNSTQNMQICVQSVTSLGQLYNEVCEALPPYPPLTLSMTNPYSSSLSLSYNSSIGAMNNGQLRFFIGNPSNVVASIPYGKMSVNIAGAPSGSVVCAYPVTSNGNFYYSNEALACVTMK